MIGLILYSNEQVHVYGCFQSILWSPLKNRMPENVRIASFGHPISKSWLRPSVVRPYGLKTDQRTLQLSFNPIAGDG